MTRVYYTQLTMAIKALIGLGNKGKEYAHTFHNIGAWTLSLFEAYAHAEERAQLLFEYPSGSMNESGAPLRSWLENHNLTAQDILIIHDDSDLPVGSYKLVQGGGSGGHKGVQSIINNLGTEDLWRLRIGIRDPQETVRIKALDFVLHRFPKEFEPIFESVAQRAWTELTPHF